ncbi:hypothetical protein [Novosphingobium sp. PhB165]|uniref:hypothetical protein n=1 Tax=Novosphingobium sp. PhB165 TaxID=2485105 RepID=UPI0010485215|nr:hypothetical protein [Novosphingobium sp. PhB165]
MSFDFRGAERRPGSSVTGVSLLFSAGKRPSVEDIERLLGGGDGSAPAARITHKPPREQGWLELLSSGLTFDLSGLAPANPASGAEIRHAYGFDAVPEMGALEAVEIVPGGHIAGGSTMLPVVRTLAGLAADLALQLPVSAVAWHSAGTVMAPGYYARMVMNWLGGGAFPVLGLTALVPAEDGSIASQGLAAFSGQEFQLEAAEGERRADTVKLAIRVVDHIVRHGPLTTPGPIDGAPGLFAEPSQVGKVVWIWRQN